MPDKERRITSPDGETWAPVVSFEPDARTGALESIEVTLSATPGTVTTITLPDDAIGFRLYPRVDHIRFAVGENPEAVGASSSTTVTAADFNPGGIAKANAWETRVLDYGASRTLRLRSTTASVVVDVEVF